MQYNHQTGVRKDMKTVIKWGLIIGIPLGIAAYTALWIIGNQIEAEVYAESYNYTVIEANEMDYDPVFARVYGDPTLQATGNPQIAGLNK